MPGNFRRFCFAVTLGTFIVAASGCATYQRTVVSGEGAEDAVVDRAKLVEEGTTVRVKLLSGETVGGTVLSVTDNEIELGSRGNYGHENATVRISDVNYIEVREQSDGLIEGGWFVGILIGLSVLLYSALQNNMN